VVAMVAFIAGMVVANLGEDPNPTRSATRVTAAAPERPATTDAPPPTEPPVTAAAAVVPKAKDFKLSVKTLSKQCFGSAGCNLTYRVDVSLAKTLDPDVEYEVVYEVRGGRTARRSTR
jgi:hypothetical protein